jgi:hypothetical protein
MSIRKRGMYWPPSSGAATANKNRLTHSRDGRGCQRFLERPRQFSSPPSQRRYWHCNFSNSENCLVIGMCHRYVVDR